MTVDGKITTRTFAPVDFTSREDKSHLIRQRALADAVLIGYGTLRRDNVRLSIGRAELREERIARKQPAYPLRVIVSNEGRIDPELNVFKTEPGAAGPILIFSTTRMPRRNQKWLREKAAVHLNTTGAVDLPWMLRQLRREYNVRSVACEGGAKLFRGLVERGLVDQLNVTIAPLLFGGGDAPTLTGMTKEFLPASVRCSLRDMRVIGNECFLTYRLRSSRE